MRIPRLLPAAALLLPLTLAACSETPVSLPEPGSVQLAVTDLHLVVGDLAPLAAQVLDQNGNVVAGANAVFASDNPTVAVVDGNGVVRAMSPGAANVTAAYGSNKAVARVTVAHDERGRVQTLDLLADSVTADVRTGSRFVPLSAYNGYGQPVCPPALTITTSDATIATAGIGGCGVQIYPHFAGTATITVGADGGQDSVRVRVTSTGTVVYISSRPDAAQGLAGNKVSYTVRVLDQQGNPVANHLVRFDVSAGTLGAATATTDNTGSATVQWTLPTALAAFGNVQTIRAGTQLPDGDLYYLSESLYVYPGPPVSFQLLRLDPPNSTFTPITTASITAHAYETVYIGALATDQYGNNTGYDFHFSVSGTGSLTCPSSGFRYGNSGIVYSCAYANAAGTLTYTVSAGGTSKSVDIVAN